MAKVFEELSFEKDKMSAALINFFLDIDAKDKDIQEKVAKFIKDALKNLWEKYNTLKKLLGIYFYVNKIVVRINDIKELLDWISRFEKIEELKEQESTESDTKNILIKTAMDLNAEKLQKLKTDIEKNSDDINDVYSLFWYLKSEIFGKHFDIFRNYNLKTISSEFGDDQIKHLIETGLFFEFSQNPLTMFSKDKQIKFINDYIGKNYSHVIGEKEKDMFDRYKKIESYIKQAELKFDGKENQKLLQQLIIEKLIPDYCDFNGNSYLSVESLKELINFFNEKNDNREIFITWLSDQVKYFDKDKIIFLLNHDIFSKLKCCIKLDILDHDKKPTMRVFVLKKVYSAIPERIIEGIKIKELETLKPLLYTKECGGELQINTLFKKHLDKFDRQLMLLNNNEFYTADEVKKIVTALDKDTIISIYKKHLIQWLPFDFLEQRGEKVEDKQNKKCSTVNEFWYSEYDNLAELNNFDDLGPLFEANEKKLEADKANYLAGSTFAFFGFLNKSDISSEIINLRMYQQNYTKVLNSLNELSAKSLGFVLVKFYSDLSKLYNQPDQSKGYQKKIVETISSCSIFKDSREREVLGYIIGNKSAQGFEGLIYNLYKRAKTKEEFEREELAIRSDEHSSVSVFSDFYSSFVSSEASNTISICKSSVNNNNTNMSNAFNVSEFSEKFDPERYSDSYY